MEHHIATSPAAITRRTRLHVIPEPDPETRSVFQKFPGAPDSVFFTGSQTTDAYVCGGCYTPLIVGLPLAPFQNLVFCCSQCGKYNETLAAGPVPRSQPAELVSHGHRKSPRRRR
jgi:hypothetical protein